MADTGFENISKLWVDRYSGTIKDGEYSVDQLVSVEEQTLIPFPYCFIFFDLEAGKLKYVSPSVEDIYGINPDDIYDGGDHLPFECVHPDEKEVVIACVQREWESFLSLEREEKNNHVACIEHRIFTTEGYQKYILHQNQIVAFTADAKPKIVLSRFIDTGTLHRQEDAHHVTYYEYDRTINKVKNLQKTLISSTPKARLTDTEQQVIGFVNKGLTSKQIAQKMDISVKTVRTHRKNIRKKRKRDEHRQPPNSQ